MRDGNSFKGPARETALFVFRLKRHRKEKASSPRGWVEEKELIKDQMGWILSKAGSETGA